jgi:hypothetical protein
MCKGRGNVEKSAREVGAGGDRGELNQFAVFSYFRFFGNNIKSKNESNLRITIFNDVFT